MTAQKLYSFTDWEVNLRRQVAQHKTGLIVYFVAGTSGTWTARRSNAVEWVKEDYAVRAPLITEMLRGAMTAYEAAQKSRNKEK